MYIADLHIHSPYSYATSQYGSPELLSRWAARKGIQLVGTGDFTHPAWREELKEKLTEAGNGFYRLKGGETPDELSIGAGEGSRHFVLTGEISCIYQRGGKTRRVHNVLVLPGFREAEELSGKLGKIGNLSSDGRPILKLDSRDLLEMALDVSRDIICIPAHIWTPHFSMFGAFTGFETVEECFGDLAPYIHALETGLSSDPAMNWRISALDGYQLVSNSDAHSPSKLGREATVLNGDFSYEGLWNAIQLGNGLHGTIEFFPEEGKYHDDGHRKCGVVMNPKEAEEAHGICPVCGKKLTFGVDHRIEQLADRQEGYVPENARPYDRIVPLPEMIAASMGYASAAGKKVEQEYARLLKKLGPEFYILREAPLEDIKHEAGEKLSEGIDRMRLGLVSCEAGYDGEYGKIICGLN